MHCQGLTRLTFTWSFFHVFPQTASCCPQFFLEMSSPSGSVPSQRKPSSICCPFPFFVWSWFVSGLSPSPFICSPSFVSISLHSQMVQGLRSRFFLKTQDMFRVDGDAWVSDLLSGFIYLFISLPPFFPSSMVQVSGCGSRPSFLYHHLVRLFVRITGGVLVSGLITSPDISPRSLVLVSLYWPPTYIYIIYI